MEFELNKDSTWLFVKYENLIVSLKKAYQPLQPYLNTFNEFKARIKGIKDDETKDIDDRLWTPEKIKEDIIDNKKRNK